MNKSFFGTGRVKIFIDGRAGTTGLRIHERLAAREDVALITLDDAQRHDPDCRRRALNEADVAFLCLPDAAAVEAAAMVENPDTVVIDTSTAHRTSEGWAYGFPELSAAHEEAIRTGKRIAVPGCHAGGFIALTYPLIAAGLLPREAWLTCFSLTGYSGGGKSMIAAYEAAKRDPLLDAPRQYGLAQQHKHLKEMCGIPRLAHTPLFCPVVGDFYSGMEVTVPLFAGQLADGVTAADVAAVYAAAYRGPVVRFCTAADQAGFLSAGTLSGTDGMVVTLAGNGERLLLTAVYDNLGKGASGAALECLNLIMGKDKAYGLVI